VRLVPFDREAPSPGLPERLSGRAGAWWMRAGCLPASVRESGPKGDGAHEPPDFEGDPDLRFLSYPGPFRVCASLVSVEGGPWICVSSGQRFGEGIRCCSITRSCLRGSSGVDGGESPPLFPKYFLKVKCGRGSRFKGDAGVEDCCEGREPLGRWR